jgi:putative oxidoreductase
MLREEPRDRGRARTFFITVLESRNPSIPADIALAGARLALAWVFIYYGAGKLFGAFNGPGLHQTALFFADTAHLHPGGFFAVFGGVIEFGGGVALTLGLVTRLAGMALFLDMMMAMVTVTWANGIHAAPPRTGYELNLALAALALIVVCLGAGRLSFDFLFKSRMATSDDTRSPIFER